MSYANVTPADIEVRAFNPARALIAPLHDYGSLRCKRSEFDQAETSFTLPLEGEVMQSSYSSQTAYQRALSGYTFDVYYWGDFFARGVAVVCDDDDEDEGGSTPDDVPATVSVECIELHHWVLSGRLIMGVSGGRFAPGTATADNVLRELWRVNCVAASIIEPAEFGTGVIDPTTGASNTVSRANFGPFTVAVEANTSSHPDTVRHRWDHGRSLWDNTVEFCRQYNLRPYYTLSGTTITLRVAYPATGTDRTASVVFSRERGNLLKFSRKVDRLATSNIAECRGLGRRNGQRKKYAQHRASYLDVGGRETAEVWRSADDDDAQNNAEFIIHQVGGAETHYVAKLAEIDAQKWGDFDRGDKVTIIDTRRGITVQDWIAVLELHHDEDDVPVLDILTGREPLGEDGKQNRSGGGGGGGGGRGGGHPKNADGETLETLLVEGDCIEISSVEDEEEGTITYTVGFAQKTWGAITVDGAAVLTPADCFDGLEIIGDRCIEVTKVDADTIRIRNTHYWINRVSIVDPSFTLTADACDEQVLFAAAGGLAWSGSGNTLTISAANLTYYSIVGGDTGSATASIQGDTIKVAGGDGIDTVAADGATDTLTIDLRLPETTSSETGAAYHKVWDAAGNPRAVKTWVATS